jgi:hypothetical protein
MAPLFIVAERREVGSSAGKEAAGTFWREKAAGKWWYRWQGGPGRRIGAGAPDRILPHRGRHGSVGSFIGLAKRWLDFGGAGVGRFSARAQFPRRPCFVRRFGGAGGDALSSDCATPLSISTRMRRSIGNGLLDSIYTARLIEARVSNPRWLLQSIYCFKVCIPC